MTRPRLLLAIILTAVAVLCISLWVGEGPLWRLIMLKQIPLSTETLRAWMPTTNSNHIRGWMSVKRWSDPPGAPHGRAVVYWTLTGFKAAEWEIQDLEGALLHE